MSETVKGVFTADISGYTGAMSKLAKSTSTATNSIKGGIGKSGGSIIKFGALAGIGAKLATSGFDMVKRGVSSMASELSSSSATWKTFSQNMAGIGKSKKQIRSVKKELQDFAQKTIYSSSDMASTYSQLAAVGVKGTNKLVKGFGGLASAAENPKQAMKTLSQQATQMAAKPMVQWQDFKLMLEQTPAGIAAVAKTMHMSTAQLVKNVQDGKIATQDFFDAVAKTGTNKTFTKMAEQYKTVGQAMDGLRETLANKLQPAFDRVSAVAIARISGIVDAVGNMNFDGVADKAVTAFTALSNATTIAYNSISSLVKWVSANKDWLAPLTVGVLAFVGTFKAVKTGIAIFTALQSAMNIGRALMGIASGSQAAGFALSMLAKESKGAAMAQAALDAVMAVNPWVLLAAAVIAVVSALTFFFTKTKTGQKVWASFTSFLSASWSKIKALAVSVWGQIGPYMVATWNSIKNTAQSVWTGITNIFTTAVGKAKSVLGNFKGSFSIVGDALEKFGGAFGKVGGTVSLVVSALSKVAFVALGLTGPWGMAASAVLGFLTAWVKTGNLNADGITQVFDNLSSTITNVADMIATYLPKFVEAGTQIIVGLINGITQKIPTIVTAITQVINSLTQAFATAMPAIITAGTQIITSLVNAIVTALPAIINAGMQIITMLITSIVTLLPQLITVGLDIIITLVNAIVTAIPQIINAGIQIITTLISAIATALPQIAIAALNIIVTLVSTLVSALPQIISAGVKLLTALITGIFQMIPVLISSAIKIVVSLASTIISNLPKIISAGVQILMALVKGILQIIGTLLSAGVKLVVSLGSTLISNAPKILAAGVKLTMALVRGVLQLLGQLIAAGAKLIAGFIRSIIQGVGQALSAGAKNAKSVASGIKSVSLVDAGMNLIKGFIQGIKNMAGAVMSAAGNLAKSAADKIKGALKIHSPSRVTAEFGMYFGAGFVRGIDGMQPAVERAATNLADISADSMDGLNASMSPSLAVSRNVDEQFSGSFDDSGLARMARMIVQAIDEKDTDLILDGDSVVKKTSGRMDNELGNNVRLRSRLT